MIELAKPCKSEWREESKRKQYNILSKERLRVRVGGGDLVSSHLPGQVLHHIQGVV
jgi:hypothetical protein